MAFGHGKLILLGEHGVVYGRPAIAASLPRGAEASTEPAAGAELAVEPWGVALAADRPHDDVRVEELRRAYCALLDAYSERPRVRVRVRLDIPTGAGLGSSAALSVAIVRALDEAVGIERESGAVAELALRAERVFHGNPSGIDSAMAVGGGVSLYRKGAPLEAIRLGRKLTLVVGNSGAYGDTGEMVSSVRRQHGRNPTKLDQIFDGMEALVLNGRSALASGELWRFGQLMTLNQKLLASLMLSTPRLEEMCQVAERAGALGAKLTGGGGGGCMIALCENVAAAERVQAALAGLGREAFVLEVAE